MNLSYFNLQVDQAVSRAFGQCRTSNYVRIQANESLAKKHSGLKKGMNHGQQKGRREKTGMTYEVRRRCLGT